MSREIRFLVALYRYFKLQDLLDRTQPVPGSRQRSWEFSTWLIALGALVGIITVPLAQPWLTYTCAATFVLGLILALIQALIQVLRED